MVISSGPAPIYSTPINPCCSDLELHRPELVTLSTLQVYYQNRRFFGECLLHGDYLETAACAERATRATGVPAGL